MRKAVLGALALSLLEVAWAYGADPRVRLLTDSSGTDDRSHNAAAWRGILQFYGDTPDKPSKKGSAYDAAVAESPDQYAPALKQLSEVKPDLVIVSGNAFSEALRQVAPIFPDQKYLIIDSAAVGQPNVMEATFALNEGSYLVGVAAALKAQADKIRNPKFGFLGGIPGAISSEYEVGFATGLLSVLPGATIIDFYAEDINRSELARAQAQNWYDSGVYCIFSAAGRTDSGVIIQAKDYRAAGRNVWAIAAGSDLYESGVYDAAGTKSAVLTSMIERVDSAVALALAAVRDGTFKGGTVVFDSRADGVSYSTRNAELGKDIVAKVEASKKAIVSGQIKVLATYAEALSSKALPPGLQAKDD